MGFRVLGFRGLRGSWGLGRGKRLCMSRVLGGLGLWDMGVGYRVRLQGVSVVGGRGRCGGYGVDK